MELPTPMMLKPCATPVGSTEARVNKVDTPIRPDFVRTDMPG